MALSARASCGCASQPTGLRWAKSAGAWSISQRSGCASSAGSRRVTHQLATTGQPRGGGHGLGKQGPPRCGPGPACRPTAPGIAAAGRRRPDVPGLLQSGQWRRPGYCRPGCRKAVGCCTDRTTRPAGPAARCPAATVTMSAGPAPSRPAAHAGVAVFRAVVKAGGAARRQLWNISARWHESAATGRTTGRVGHPWAGSWMNYVCFMYFIQPKVLILRAKSVLRFRRFVDHRFSQGVFAHPTRERNQHPAASAPLLAGVKALGVVPAVMATWAHAPALKALHRRHGGRPGQRRAVGRRA